MTIDPQAEAIKRLLAMAKSASQRTPLMPKVTVDPDNPPVGLAWIRADEQKAYLKVDEETTLLIASATPAEGGGGVVEDRSLPGIKLRLNTVTSDEIASNAVGAAELASASVSGPKWTTDVSATSSLTLVPSIHTKPGLQVDVPDSHTSDLMKLFWNGSQRFRVGQNHVSVGGDLPSSAMSVHTTGTETALRLRTSGNPIVAERQDGQALFTVDPSGNLVIAGSVVSQTGNSETGGSLVVRGALTVSNQANFLSGGSFTGRVDLRAELDVDGRATFEVEPFLPPNYTAKLGNTAHLRAMDSYPNRVVLEGTDELGAAEVQLGTGGPVLSGSLSAADRMFISGQRILTSSVDGMHGSQIALDTLTGGTGAGLGNIAAETITGYNIKNGSVTSTELSPGAVIAQALADGAVGTVAMADGSVIDRIVASMGVGKLISGTLNADEIYMGPSGHIYMGPSTASQINGARVQMDASGIVAYNTFNSPLAEFKPGSFALRTGVDGARMSISASTGLELFGASGARTGYLSPLGQFQLDSLQDGARMSLNSQEGVAFYAGATRNLVYNPGFIETSNHDLPVAGEASDDQRHVFAGEWAVKFRATNPNVAAPSYVDVPFQNTVGTGSTVTASRMNYCLNPGLATTLNGYLGAAPTSQVATRVPVLGFIKSFAAQVMATADGDANLSAPLQAVSPGQQWALSCSVRASAPTDAFAVIDWFDVDNVVLRSDTSEAFGLNGNVVAQIGMVGVAPASATQARLRIRTTLRSTDTMQVTDVLYERASGIGSFVDGDTMGYKWDGTPGNSTSSLLPVAVPDSADNLLSVFVWSDVWAWTQIEGRDSTSGVSRGLSSATRLTPNQWSRVSVRCTGRMDRVRLHFPSEDGARQTRIVSSPLWYSALQVEADKLIPTPFCSGNEPGCRWEGLAGKSASIRDRDTVVTQISPSLGTTVSGAIVGGSLTSSSFFAGRIFGTEITGGRITGNIITGNQINGEDILANTLHGNSIVAHSVTAAEIDVDTIEADNIKSGAITSDKLESELILANQIIAGDKDNWHLELGRADAPILWWNNEKTGFALTRDPATGDSNVFLSGRVQFGDGSQIDADVIDLMEQPSVGFQEPKVRQYRAWVQSAPSTSLAPQWLSATRKNSLLLLAVTVYTDVAGNVPTLNIPSGFSQISTVVQGNTRMSYFYMANVPTSRSKELLNTNFPCRWLCYMVELDGIETVNSLDVFASSSGTSTTASTGTTAVTSAPNEVAVAFWNGPGTTLETIPSKYVTPSNGFMFQSQTRGAVASWGAYPRGMAFAIKRLSSTGAQSSSITVDNTNWMGTVATFKLAPASMIPSTPEAKTVRMYTQRRSGASTPHFIDENGLVYPIGRLPLCRVKLNVNVGIAGNNDVYAQGDWSVLYDSDAMASISTNVSTYSNIQVPLDGFYHIDFRSMFSETTNATDSGACFVTKNSRTVAASVARGISKYTQAGTDGSPVRASRIVQLAAGDLLFWGNWSSVNASLVALRNGIPTEITVSYLRPL